MVHTLGGLKKPICSSSDKTDPVKSSKAPKIPLSKEAELLPLDNADTDTLSQILKGHNLLTEEKIKLMVGLEFIFPDST